MLDLGRTNTEGKHAKGTVRGRVRVTTYKRSTGHCESLFGADDVHNALTAVCEAKEREAKLLDVLLERNALETRVTLLHECFGVFEMIAAHRGNVVVDGRERAVRSAHWPTCQAQALERLWGCDFVHEMTVDVYKTCAIFLFRDEMCIKNFLIDGARRLGLRRRHRDGRWPRPRHLHGARATSVVL